VPDYLISSAAEFCGNVDVVLDMGLEETGKRMVLVEKIEFQRYGTDKRRE